MNNIILDSHINLVKENDYEDENQYDSIINTTSSEEDSFSDENSVSYYYDDYIHINGMKYSKEDLYKNFSIKINSIEIFIDENDLYPIYLDKYDFKKYLSNDNQCGRKIAINDSINNCIDEKLYSGSPYIHLYINSKKFKSVDSISSMNIFYELIIYLYIYNNFTKCVRKNTPIIIPYNDLVDYKLFRYIKKYIPQVYTLNKEDRDENYNQEEYTTSTTTTTTNLPMDITYENENEDENYNDNDNYKHIHSHQCDLFSIKITSIETIQDKPYNHLNVFFSIDHYNSEYE